MKMKTKVDPFKNFRMDLSAIRSKNQEDVRALMENRKKMYSRNRNRFIEEGNHAKIEQIQGDKSLVEIDYSEMVTLFGDNKDRFKQITIGSHPDFSDLGMNQIFHHYAVSAFIDIKGSTRLSSKYDLKEIRLIKDSILTTCIYFANFFGGHIQRLQGDGIFLYFVRRGQHPNNAMINALNATSLICYFIEHVVAEEFNQMGIDPLKIRVGIDYGTAEKVIWSYYGIPNCYELTTTSLHTDLAAKLQGKAKPNGILIGNNCKELLDLPEEFISRCKNNQGEIDRYIFRDHKISYSKWEFNWQKYLLSFDFFSRNQEGQVEFSVPENRIICKYFDLNNLGPEVYPQNLFSLPKDLKLEYTLVGANGSVYKKMPMDTIKWFVQNRGAEATDAEDLNFEVEDSVISQNRLVVEMNTRYLGHHYMLCKQFRNDQVINTFKFPIFVQ